MQRTFGLLLLGATLCGCPQQPTVVSALGVAGAGANFTLSCHSASTATARQVHCIRTDTRTGEVQRVNIDKLPVSTGSSGGAAAAAGRYQTSCVTAATADQADFICARINTESGEMMMVNLQKVTQVP